jgi:nicotinamide phosphoribosyltransferase
LISFLGTDDFEALLAARKYCGADMAGFSIPAMEHSTVTSWGKEGEADSYSNMLDSYAKPGALVACVSDSYNLDFAVDEIWGKQLRSKLAASGATLVVRPDSGVPKVVVLRTLESLGKSFGFSVNSKGYRVLDPSVRVIQGDGMSPDTIRELFQAVTDAGWSAENISVGMGGGLLQHVNRDTQRFAMKCSWVGFEDGTSRNVFKDPATDPEKRSKAGRLDLVRKDGEYITVGYNAGDQSQLIDYYCDGEILVNQTLDEIRSRARLPYSNRKVLSGI